LKFGRDRVEVPAKGRHSPWETIEFELDRNENLIWADGPVFLFNHAKTAIPTMLFGIPFFAFSIFWINGAMETVPGSAEFSLLHYAFPLFGVPFVLVGLTMLLAPLWQIFKARSIIYAITDKRLIIREATPFKRIRSWPLNSIGKLTRNGTADGPGDLYFTDEIGRNSDGDKTITKIGFIGVSEPKRLEEEIRSRINGD
jgi:hypothetical protein